MSRFIFIWVITLILELNFSSFALAAGPLGDIPHFSRISINAAESVGEILAITQDHNGFLWFAGRNGLARYDGYRFHTYRANPKDKTALGESYLTDVFEDSYGDLWVATYGGGIARLNRTYDNFRTYKYEETAGGKTNTQKFDELFEDDQRNLWVVGNDGIAMYDRTQDVFIRYLHDNPSITDPILEMVHIKNDDFLLITASAGYVWNRTTGTLEKFQPSNNNNKILPLAVSRSSLNDSKGNIWIGGEQGLYKFIPSSKTFETIPLRNVVEDIKSVSIWKLIEDKNGILWIGTDGNGLMYYDPNTQKFGQYTRSALPTSLGAPVVRTVFEDREGDLWVSTFPTGLYHYNKTNNYFSYYSNFIKNKYDVYANTTWSFLEDAHHNVWMGLDSLGLVYFDRQNNSFSQTYDGFNFAEHKFPNTVLSLLQDSRGNLWMGSWAQGVTRFNPTTKDYTHYNPNALGNSPFEGESVWSIMEAKNGDIYFGTMNHGVIKYSYASDQFTNYKNNKNYPNGNKTPNNNAGWSLLENDDGRIWIGTNHGINVFDPKTQQFSYYEMQSNNPNSLSSNIIIWIYKDSKSRIWICTSDGGLNLYHPENNSFSQIRTKEGLSDKDVQFIIEDNNGVLWFASMNTIVSLNPDTLERHTYTDQNWIQNGEFNHGSAYKLSSGELLFGGANGFNVLIPENVMTNQIKPNIFFTELELLNKNIIPSQPNKVIKGDILNASSITLTHEDSMFSLRFMATNYRAFSDNMYTYKLEGFDSEWHKESRNNKATYTHLDAGRYRFLVRAANNDHVWSDKEKSIEIIVLPAPWKTWWAYCIYFGVGLGIIVWYMVAQQKKYLNEKRLNAKLRELDKLKDDFMANTSHELRTPINGIIGIAQALYDGFAGAQTTTTLQYIEMILRSGRRLERLVSDVLDFSLSKSASLKLENACFDITAVIDDVVLECSSNISNNQLTLTNSATGRYPPLFGDSERTRRVVFNLVANAIKYTEQGTITIAVDVLEKTLCISVRDTGIGIAADHLPKIYDSFTQVADSGALMKNGAGLGLSVAKYFVNAQGGELQVESIQCVGSTFKVFLPQASPEQLENATIDIITSGVNPVAPVQASQPSTSDNANGHKTFDTNETGYTSDEQNEVPVFYPDNYQPNEKYKNILVVDDEVINRTILRSIGLRNGYVIYEAANGQQAVDALNNNLACDLILLDVMMPKLSGIEACRIIRTFYTQEQLPIIFVSAKTQPNDIDECFRVQGNDFMAKPVNHKALISCIEKHLARPSFNKAADI